MLLLSDIVDITVITVTVATKVVRVICNLWAKKTILQWRHLADKQAAHGKYKRKTTWVPISM